MLAATGGGRHRDLYKARDKAELKKEGYLEFVTSARWQEEEENVNHVLHFNFTLAHPHSLDENLVVACSLHDTDRGVCATGHASQDTFAGRWPNEGARVLSQL